MSKINIFRKEWLDIVFEGRNKSYGAYRLRSKNPRVTAFSLFLGISLFGLGIASPLIIGGIEGTLGIIKKKKIDKVIEVIDLTPPPPPVEIPQEAAPPPPPPEAPASIKDQVKFTPPKVVDKDEVKPEEEIATIEELKNADPSTKTKEGNPDGDIIINKEAGDGPKDSEGSGDGDPDQIFTHVQVQAGPPGGMAGFNKTFINRFRTPDLDSSVKRIQVIVQFVVERDGSLTDINVLRDPGYGAGKEAVRVLKGMPKWKPAVQNGKTVRSRFTLPITIQVQ